MSNYLRIICISFVGCIMFFGQLYGVSLRASSGALNAKSDREGTLVINEVMAANSTIIVDEDGDFSDWIELYNSGSVSVNLLNYGLSDDTLLPYKWVFPNVTLPAGSFLLVWTSNKNRAVTGAPLHTNFKISSDGEEVLITDPLGTLVDELPILTHYTDLSVGRFPDSTGDWFYFTVPTPLALNSTQSYSEVLSPPAFSMPGGFYTQTFDLSISHPDPDAVIIYTLDGSEPDIGNLSGTVYGYKNNYPQAAGDPLGTLLEGSYISSQYLAAIPIVDRSNEPDQITHISTTWDLNPGYFPDSPVQKGTVVKAKVFKPNAVASVCVTQTYFVLPEGRSAYQLPVVALSVQEDLMFDYNDGIYVAGVDRDNWVQYQTGVQANWRRDGDIWEYPANFEFFDENATLAALNQRIGFRIHGMASNTYSPRKSLRLYARDEYGTSSFQYQFFPEMTDNSFKRIILRNSGNDWNRSQFRDAAIQTVCRGLRFDTQAYRPSVLFVNGEYWGIHNIRERYDEHYLARVYGVDSENVDILELNDSVIEGSAVHYLAMKNYLLTHDMSDASNYAYIQTHMDIENFIDYHIAQIFVRNQDWPQNNIKYWRLRTTVSAPDAPYGHDGRWRWLMYDTDQGLAGNGTNSYVDDTLDWLTQSTNGSAPIFNALITNNEFKTSFINRFADLMNTTFLPSRIASIINQIKQKIEPEIPEHINRWSTPSSVTTWQSYATGMITFANNRPAYQRQHIKDKFGLAGDFNVVLDVNDSQQGHIQINTIDITAQTEGISGIIYPWTGVYFQGIPVSIEAIPEEGYEFSHWEGSSQSSEAILNLVSGENIALKAYFVETQSDEAELIHYWHFDALPGGAMIYVNSDFSLIGNPTITYPGTGTGYMDDRTHRAADPVSNLNLQMGQLSDTGAVLRVRNPSNTRQIVIDSPTTGFENIVVTFATSRTSNGATQQEFYYSPDAGQNWILVGTAYPVTELLNWGLVTFDLSGFTAANNNPDLKFRILFVGDNTTLTAGNARFDNLTVHGVAMEMINLPPVVVMTPPLQYTIEDGASISIELSDIFSDPENDALLHTTTSSRPAMVQAQISNGKLELLPLQRGDAQISVTADDGSNPEISINFRVLVYPRAYELSKGSFAFNSWSADAPELTYPENMLFLQSDVNDPNANNQLLYPYYIAHDDYATEDLPNVGFPYKNTSRTRMNGLGPGGVSFINTGRGRDVGGVLVALDTRNTSFLNMGLSFGTILRNSRLYALKVQYRTDIDEPFTDVIYNNEPLVYEATANGDVEEINGIILPDELLDQEYVQLLVRYCYVSGTSGARAQLKVDDILILGSDEPLPVVLSSFTALLNSEYNVNLAWNTQSEAGMLGFYVFRANTEELSSAQIISPMIPATNTSQQQSYTFIDTDLSNSGVYYYWLQSLDLDSNNSYHGPISVYYSSTGDDPTPEIPLITELKSVYPNPFNPTIFIPYSVAITSDVSLKMYNSRGQIVRQIELGNKAPGNYRTEWNGTDSNGQSLANGVYYIKMFAGKESYLRKAVLIK